jgi:hypothetical protein
MGVNRLRRPIREVPPLVRIPRPRCPQHQTLVLAKPIYPCLEVRPVVLARKFETDFRQHVHMHR